MIHKTFENMEIFLETDDAFDRFFKYEIDSHEAVNSSWKYHLLLFNYDGSSFDLYGKANIQELYNFIGEMLKKE